MGMNRINRKLDLIMEKLGVDTSGLEPKPAPPRELTPQEQDAINNAPKAEASVPPAEPGPRVTDQNAPDTSSSVPKDAVGTVTIETEQPDGKKMVQTKPASEAKGKKGNVTPAVNWNS